MGGVDTLINHELLARLPKNPNARAEIGLHAIREAIYATLFGGLAWFAWHGAAAVLIGILVIGELLITIFDEYIENHIRILPHNERILHVLLTLNLGVIIAALTPTLLFWSSLPTALVHHYLGWQSWALSALALIGATWFVRDVLAWRHIRVKINSP